MASLARTAKDQQKERDRPKAKATENMGLVLEVLFFLFMCGGGDGAPLVPAMFVFGDSLVDSGNNNYMPTLARANYFPYGIDFGFPTGRFCNGLTVVDYGGKPSDPIFFPGIENGITEYAQYLGLPLIPPYLSVPSGGVEILRGLNYASAAAGILDDTGQYYGARTTFNEQILQFETTLNVSLRRLFVGTRKLSQYVAKSIFLINIGSNDYINNYLQPERYISGHIYNPEEFVKLLIDTLSTQLSKLYRLGARKFVLAGIGPLGCIPSQLSMANGNVSGCIDQINDLVTKFNTHLIQLTATLNATLPGSFYVYQNVFDPFIEMVSKPARYGFLVPNEACCGNGKYGGDITCLPFQQPCAKRDQYIFWDAFHPTEAANKIVAGKGFSDSAMYSYPISIYKLAQL